MPRVVTEKFMNQFASTEKHGQSDGRTVQTTIGAEGGAEFKIGQTGGNIRIERNDASG